MSEPEKLTEEDINLLIFAAGAASGIEIERARTDPIESKKRSHGLVWRYQEAAFKLRPRE